MVAKAAKQDSFIWEGIDKRGQIVKGEISGPSTAMAKAMLRRQGVNPTKVKRKPKPLFGFTSRPARIKAKDISIFSRQLSTMMTSGVPLVQTFDIIGKGHSNKSMQALMASIRADIESGSNLSEALRKHPMQFDDLFCNLVSAGEHAGILDNVLDKIATYKEKTEAIKGKVKKAMFYPTAVVIVAIIITIIMMVVVIPSFSTLFSGYGAELPALTRFVITLSEFFQAWWIPLVLAMIGGIYGLLQMKKRSKPFNNFLDRTILKIPLFGPIFRKAAIARYARTLSTMFAAGVPLVEAMQSVSGAVGNVVYGDAVLKMRDEVSTGTQLNVAMRQTGLFPSMVNQMTAIGEEAGSVDAMLAKVADFYEEEVDNSVDGLSSLLEPIIMVVLGGLIGGLVIAMYLPVFQMGKIVGN
ncbi:MAG: type II secretion system F family protein [Gammaproteobacteria bacterium]|nr:type II secretion system F family protein [Gammaproteobacteria bacterium]